MSDHERLRRLLFLVPFVARNQGRTVDEVAAELGLTRDRLLEDLDLLTMVGRPPFQPDDFIDIYVEDDRIYVDLHQRLSAPPRLTAAEAVALSAAARLLGAGAGRALTSAVEKLERVIPPHAVDRFREMGRRLDLSLEAPRGLSTLSQAIVERREVAFDYVSGARGSSERRHVRPAELFSHRGQWYLSGYDVSRADDRLFRLDRMGAVELTARKFEPQPGEARAALPTLKDAVERVTVRFSTERAPYVRERFGADATLLPDGQLEVSVPGDNARWLTGWVLSFGGDARVVSPEWAVRRVAEAARAALG